MTREESVSFTTSLAMTPKTTTPKTLIASSIPAVKATIHQSTAAKTAQKIVIHQSVFDALPDSAFIREAQLVQSPKRPGVAALLPFSAPTLWRLSKIGAFPAPVKLSSRVTAWNVGSVRAWMAAQATA